MNFEGKSKKSEQADSQENKPEKELSISEIDELIKQNAGIFDDLNKFSKDEFFKKVDFYGEVEIKDKLDDKYDSDAYAKAGFWKKYENFTRLGFHKERHGLLKSEERGLLDKSKINKDVLGKEIEQSVEETVDSLDIKKSDLGEKLAENLKKEDIKSVQEKFSKKRTLTKRYEVVDGEIVKIIKSRRTESGAVEAAGKMREAEIGRLETVNGAELVGLKESIEKNKQTKENMLKMSGFMSEKDKRNLTDKLNKEEADKKERIKEKEKKIADETMIFREPLEGRLKETSEVQNNLSEALDFIKAGESDLNGNIKECEAFIKEAQKLNLSDEVRADIVKNAEAQKAELNARAKEFAERKGLVASKLEVLKNNKKEIEATLTRVNSIGKTKQEIGKDGKEDEGEEKDKKTETEPKLTKEKEGKDNEREKKTWDETWDEVWGLNNTQKTAPSDKKGGKKIDIGELFEHYDDSSFEETRKADDKKDEAKEKVETKKRKKARVKDKPKNAKKTEAPKNTGKSRKTESGVTTQIETEEESGVMETDQAENVKFTDEEIEKIVMKELKTVGFMNNKKVAEKSRDGLTKHLIGAVKNETLKSPEKVTEKFIKNEVDDWYKRLTKNLNESDK